MQTEMTNSNSRPWHLRLTAGLLLLLWLIVRAFRSSSPGEAWILAASFTILAHLLIGVWVFLHKLRATSAWHRSADAFAFLFLSGAVASTANTPLWCAFFSGLFAVAILKYHLCAEAGLSDDLTAYTREKIRLEAPAVVVFVLAALVTARLPETHPLRLRVEALLFFSAILFAFYLIALRRIYVFK